MMILSVLRVNYRNKNINPTVHSLTVSMRQNRGDYLNTISRNEALISKSFEHTLLLMKPELSTQITQMKLQTTLDTP